MKIELRFILLALLLLSITTIQGQKSEGGIELSEIRKNKNHLELDIKNVFTGLNNATMLYKRKYESGKLINVKQIKLLRFLARFNSQFTFTDDPTRDVLNEQKLGLFPSNLINIQLGIGIEKQFMNKGYVHYYGIDLIGRYTKNDDDFSNGTLGNVTVNYTYTTDRLLNIFNIGLNPFFGIKYYITNRISIGIETGLEVSYFNATFTEIEILHDSFGTLYSYTELEPFSANGLLVKFNNLRFLTMGYNF